MRRAIARTKAPEPTAMATNSSKPRPTPPSSKRHHQSCSFLLVFLGSAILLLIIHLLIKFSRGDSNSLRYSIIIDAGSTGSRIHVIGYRMLAGGKAVPVDVDFGLSGSKKVVPGLSAYALKRISGSHGEGGILRNSEGERFMEWYSPTGKLSCFS